MLDVHNPLDVYAHDLVRGIVPAGKFHRLAGERHLRDRARQATPAFPYLFDLARADRFVRFAQRLRHYKGEWGGRYIVLQPHQQFRLGSLFGWVQVDTGRRRFRTHYNEIPRKNGKSLEAAIVALYATFFDGEPGAEGFCLHPNTRVLLADLSWRELESINVGDEVMAVDESVAGFRQHRKMRVATVVGKVRTRRPALRMTFDSGAEVVCSPDHKWLSQSPGGTGFRFRESRALKAGYRISYLGEPWGDGRTWDAGYLSGLYDGEGYLCTSAPHAAFKVGFSQKPGAVLDACVATLARVGISHKVPRPHAGGTLELDVTGLYQCLRLLGEVRPRRLWAKSRSLWEGKKFPSRTAAITRVERIGFEDLIDIETTARTFIAEGLVSHNCVATKREQAKIVFDACKRLVLSSNLRSRIVALMANLHRDDTASKLEPLGADRDSTDGLNPHVIIIDEAHAIKKRGMIDVMETATAARGQPITYWITTAGDNPKSPCGDQHDYACKILEQVQTDETFFAFIAHADIGDDWKDENTWRKANPNFGVSVNPEDLRALATKAVFMSSAEGAFRQKHLNEWVNTSAPWLSMDGWRRGQSQQRDAVATRAWTAEAWAAGLERRRCFLGIDMSSKIDLTAVAGVFPPEGEDRIWRVVIWCLKPEETLLEHERRDRARYQEWVGAGYLKTNPGNRIDQDVVRQIVRDASTRYDVQGVGIDPWNAGNLIKDLETDGNTVVVVPQNMQQMSLPSKEFEADVLDGLVDAGGNPLMSWCVSNAVVQSDGKDNIYPVKKKSRGRIDPVIATLIARKLATLPLEPPKSYQMMFLGGR